ncbi:MAG: hypothetical protein Q4G51_06850 [Dermatophilus congolensis]|nr:hypothetical protein [Dermatophilus congolensis]
MRLTDYFLVLRRSLILLLIMGVLGGLAGVASSMRADSGHQSRSRVLATSPRLDNISASQLSLGVQRMATYAQLVTGTDLAERIVKRLGTDQNPRALASAISVELERDATVMQVSIKGDDPEQLDAVLEVLPQELEKQLDEKTAIQGAEAPLQVRFSNIDGPSASPAGSLRGTMMSAIFGVLVGLIVGLLLVAVRTRRNPVVRSPQHVSELTGAPAVATVPAMELRDTDQSHGTPVVAHRLAVRTQHSLRLPEPSVIALAGVAPSVGTSAVVAVLARAWAERGKRVLVIDAETRTRGAARALGLGADVAGIDVTEPSQIPALALPSPFENGVYVLPLGTHDDGVTQTATQARAFVAVARDHFDVVLIDVGDVPALSRNSAFLDLVDGVLLVYSQRTSHERDVADAVDSLSKLSPAGIGLVANEGHIGRTRNGNGNGNGKGGKLKLPALKKSAA